MMLLVIIFIISFIVTSHCNNFYQDVDITWGGSDHTKISDHGQLLTLSLDQASGAGVRSKKQYLFSMISMQCKLIPGDSAGTATTFYMSSDGSLQDEIDFEFLGNLSGQPYIVHTNVYTSGKGDREQQFYLWFDPTKHFHKYSILWNPKNIIFSVDGTPIRVFGNLEDKGVPFLKNKPMRMDSTLWNADDWATRGGQVKIDWSKAPFMAQCRDFHAAACVWSRGSAPCSVSDHPWMNLVLTSRGKRKLKRFRERYLIYDYCTDYNRHPSGLPIECQ